MGYSAGYNYFTGGAEVAAGLLLLFRRTTTYGSLVAITVLNNIVMINFCYDVPVKLFSLHLLLMAVFILSFDIKRVVNFFFLNKAVSPVELSPAFDNMRFRKASVIFKYLLICFFIFSLIQLQLTYLSMSRNIKQKTFLYGSYEVESFTKNREAVSIFKLDSLTWKNVFIPVGNYWSIKMLNDSLRYFSAETDTSSKTIQLSDSYNISLRYKFQYSQPDVDKIELSGMMFNDTLNIRMKKFDKNYLLLNRGFHWINEYPYNR